MSIFEYDEERHIKMEKEWSFQQGLKQGLAQGKEHGLAQGLEQGEERILLLYQKLMAENKTEDLKKAWKMRNTGKKCTGNMTFKYYFEEEKVDWKK